MKTLLIAAAVAGLMSVPVSATPLGYQYFCSDHPSECVKSGSSIVSLEAVQSILSTVNSNVNRSISPQADTLDVWKLSPRAGDCEDYALTKRSLLRRAGVPSNSMSIGIYRLSTGQNHAVLVVHTDQGDIVLDNMSTSLRVKNRSMELI